MVDDCTTVLAIINYFDENPLRIFASLLLIVYTSDAVNSISLTVRSPIVPQDLVHSSNQGSVMITLIGEMAYRVIESFQGQLLQVQALANRSDH
ncbi:hypothetical protein TIFTF001_047826, partial [Ficus carica]